jgi:hypothetical protein
MTKRRAALLAAGAALAAVSAAYATRPHPAGASDHNEPQSINAIAPGTLSDAGDIYGNFAFPTDDSVVMIITFPAPPWGFGYLPGPAPADPWDETHPHAYDSGVLYAFHIDRDFGLIGDRNIVEDEITITARFGYNPVQRRWGIRVEGIPEEGVLEGPIGEPIVGASGARVQAGLFDEPFFVDLERFFEGLDTDVLAFRTETDFFVGYNVKGIVVEIPKENVATLLRRNLGVWTTAHRLGDDPHVRPGNDCRGHAP